MKKVILLTTVLGLGALGMACGEAANNTNTNRPNTNIAPVSSPSPVMSPANTATGNTTNSNMKPANSSMANNSAMKPSTAANNTNKPK